MEDGNRGGQTRRSSTRARLPRLFDGAIGTMNDDARQHGTVERAAPERVAYLSSREIDRLTSYKWRYALESHGFSSAQAHRLVFMKWLYGHGTVRS
jgi:hypothetical protein